MYDPKASVMNPTVIGAITARVLAIANIVAQAMATLPSVAPSNSIGTVKRAGRYRKLVMPSTTMDT